MSAQHRSIRPGTMVLMLLLACMACIPAACAGPGSRAARPTATRGLADLPPALLDEVRVPGQHLQPFKKARVLRVVDGDTVELEIGGRTEKLRLIGVNTPETVDPRREIQPYGKEASDFTRGVLSGQVVYVEQDLEERDPYDRLLGYVYLEDGVFFNALLVRAGFAQTMTVSPNVKYATRFRDLMRQARAERRGLWGLPENKDDRRR